MSFTDYYKDYLYQVDYRHPESVNHNESVVYLATGIKPAVEIRTAFPKGVFVEYNDRKLSRAATSLFLVFQKFGQEWYLVCLTQINGAQAHGLF